MHAEHALEAARAKPYSAGENHSFGQNSATKPGERSIPRTSGADDLAQKTSPAVLIGKQGMPTFELTLKLCPYGLEVVVEAEVYVRGAETVTVLFHLVALAIAEFTEAGHEVPVAVEVNGETGAYAYRPAELAAGNCFLRSPVEAECTVNDEAHSAHTASRVTEIGVELEYRRVVLVSLRIVERIADGSTDGRVVAQLVTDFGSERHFGFHVFGAPETEFTTEIYLCVRCESSAYEGEGEYDFLHCRNLFIVGQ